MCNEFTYLWIYLTLGIQSVTYLSRASIIAGDIIVLVCTWIKTFRQWRSSRQVDMKVSITSRLIQDGKFMIPPN